jgi:hypothetical protein
MQLFNAMDEDKKGFLTREVFLEPSVILHGYKFCGEQQLLLLQENSKKLAAKAFEADFDLNPLHEVEALCEAGGEKHKSFIN